MALLSFILFGIFQISQIYAAKEIMMNAAVSGARARTVGLNEFMVYKVVRAASTPGREPEGSCILASMPSTTGRCLITSHTTVMSDHC